MRRLMPMWASLIAVLLLLQWGGVATPCVTVPGGPTMVVCHVGDPPASALSDGLSQQPGQHPGQHMDMSCPLCAPLPPALIPVLPALHRPAVPGRLTTVALAPRPQMFARHAFSQQPRAPPILS